MPAMAAISDRRFCVARLSARYARTGMVLTGSVDEIRPRKIGVALAKR